MIKSFSEEAWEDYLYWEKQDTKTLKRINSLIKDIERDPTTGIGKPEMLKYELSGKCSRRINEKHRLVYSVEGNTIRIYSCRNHY